MTEQSLTFEYRLSDTELKLINKYIESPNEELWVTDYFEVSDLLFTIKGTEDFPQVKSQIVKIRSGFRVWNLNEYAKANDKYFQRGN